MGIIRLSILKEFNLGDDPEHFDGIIRITIHLIFFRFQTLTEFKVPRSLKQCKQYNDIKKQKETLHIQIHCRVKYTHTPKKAFVVLTHKQKNPFLRYVLTQTQYIITKK